MSANESSDSEDTLKSTPSPGGQERRSDTNRARLNSPISVIIEEEDGTRVGAGSANLRDLSLNGALVTDVSLSNGEGLEPDGVYVVKFRLVAGPLAGMEAVCRSVRYDSSCNGFGVRIPDGFRLPIA